MRINKLLGSAMAVLAGICLFCSSCTQDDPTISRGGEAEEIPANYVKMIFTLKGGASPQTYANEVLDDSFDKDLMLLILLEEKDGKHYDSAQRMLPMKKVKDEPQQYSALLPYTLATKMFTVFVCSNASSILVDSEKPADMPEIDYVNTKLAKKTEAEIITELTFATESFATGEATTLPMWGMIEGQSFRTTDVGTEVDLGKIELLRAMTRIDVGLSYSGNTATDTPGKLDNFKIENIYVERSFNEGQLIPNKENFDYSPSKDVVYTVKNPSVATGAVKVESFSVATDKGGNSVLGKIYIPEQINSSDGDDFDKRPCLIVEGYYTPKGSVTATKYFYRLDFKKTVDEKDIYIEILRNRLIRMNITEVNGIGYGSKEEALRSKPLNIVVELADYNLEYDNVVINGEYYLSAGKKEIVMPRVAEATYNLHIVTDIPLSDLKRSFEDEDKTLFTLGEFVAVEESEKNNEYTLKITTVKAWADTDQEKILTITGQRLTMKIPVRQINQSGDDWLKGDDEDKTLEGSQVSLTSISFVGAGGVNQVAVQGAYALFNVSYVIVKEDETEEPVTQDWLTATQAIDKNEFTVKAVANLDALARTVRIKLVSKTDAITAYTITVNQSVMAVSNLKDTRGILWRDRNEGAISNGAEGNQFRTYSEEVLRKSGNGVCPSGWVLPSQDDYSSLGKEFAYTTVTPPKLGASYVVMKNTINKMYFPTAEGQTIGNMPYWTLNGTKGMFVTLPVDANGNYTGGIAEELDTSDGYVRCVRKFQLETNEVELNMLGVEEYVNYTTLYDGEIVALVGESSKGFIVKPAGKNRLSISRSSANLEGGGLNETLTLKGSGSVSTQSLKVTQLGKRRLADAGHPVVIGNVAWYYRNLGANVPELGENVFVYVPWAENKSWTINETPWSQLVGIEGVTTADLAAKIDRAGDRDRILISKDGCKALAPVGTWRVPTLQEWADLYNHIRIVKKPFAEGISEIPHNTKEYPVYIIADKESMAYIPIGVMAGAYDKTTPTNTTRYWTFTDGDGPNRYYVEFSRLLNDHLTGAALSYPQDASFWSKDKKLINYGYQHLQSACYVRCVKSVK